MTVPLELTGLTKVFNTPSGPFVAVKDVNAAIRAGEFVAVLGHSGCGKSTVLSMIAGLERATYGGVVIEGTEVVGPGAERAIVFQSPCLLPWLTARANVLLAAAQRPGIDAIEQRASADAYLALVGVADAADQLPGQLSLGTQQCVSLARALSLEPRFLLLDEPFSQLDSLTRFELQDILLRVWEESDKTVVMVTHDVDEALYLADRLILMTDGPEATVADSFTVPFPRPRRRAAVLAHADTIAAAAASSIFSSIMRISRARARSTACCSDAWRSRNEDAPVDGCVPSRSHAGRASGHGVPRRRRPRRPRVADGACPRTRPAGRRRAARPSGQRRDPRPLRALHTGHRRRQSRAWSTDEPDGHRAAAHRARQGRPRRGSLERRRSPALRPWQRGGRGVAGRRRAVRDRSRSVVGDGGAGLRRDSADGTGRGLVGGDRGRATARDRARHRRPSHSRTRLSCSWVWPTRRRCAISGLRAAGVPTRRPR